MNRRTELLAEYLNVLDEINIATKTGLRTLEKNAETTSMIIEELIHGVVEAPLPDSTPLREYISDVEELKVHEAVDIDSIAEDIANQIRKQESGGYDRTSTVIGFNFDPEEVSVQEVMKLVNQKLREGSINDLDDNEGEYEDDIDFENPLK